jgi:hypothetical protein
MLLGQRTAARHPAAEVTLRSAANMGDPINGHAVVTPPTSLQRDDAETHDPQQQGNQDLQARQRCGVLSDDGLELLGVEMEPGEDRRRDLCGGDRGLIDAGADARTRDD